MSWVPVKSYDALIEAASGMIHVPPTLVTPGSLRVTPARIRTDRAGTVVAISDISFINWTQTDDPAGLSHFKSVWTRDLFAAAGVEPDVAIVADDVITD